MSEEPQSTASTATKPEPAQVAMQLFQQWKTIIMHPKQFFADMPLAGGFMPPLMFVAAMGLLAATGALLGSIFNPFAAIDIAVKTLLGTIIGSFVGAGITWILCKLFGGKGNYEQTFRACAYSSAAHAFAIIPKIGIVGSVYGIYLLYLALKRAHGLSSGKAAAVVAIEVTALFIAIAVLVGAAILAAIALGHR